MSLLKLSASPPPFLFQFICYFCTTLLFLSSSCLVMKHEVIYYDNSIDKEGHKGCILAEFRSVVKDTKSNTKYFTKSISIHSDYQSVHFW